MPGKKAKRLIFFLLFDFGANSIWATVCGTQCFKSAIPLLPQLREADDVERMVWLGRKAAAWHLMMGHSCVLIWWDGYYTSGTCFVVQDRTELHYATKSFSPELASVYRQSADF